MFSNLRVPRAANASGALASSLRGLHRAFFVSRARGGAPLAALVAPLVAALALVVGGASCQLRVSSEEARVGSRASGFGGLDTGCLNGTVDLIASYFEGKASAPEVEAKWDCGLKALDLFLNRTVGREKDRFSPSELQRFLTKYFVTDRPITDELMQEFMELKAALLGGTPKSLSKDELLHLEKILRTLKASSLELLPEMPVTPSSLLGPAGGISQSGKSAESESDRSESDRSENDRSESDRIERVVRKIEAASGDLVRVLMERPGVAPGEIAPVHYSFRSLARLLGEIAKVYPGDSPRILLQRIPLLIALKRLLVSPYRVRLPSGELADGLTGRQLMRLFDVAARGYGVWLRLSRAFKGGAPLEAADGRQAVHRALGDLLALAKNAVAQYPMAAMPFSEFRALVAALEDADLAPFRRSTIEGLIAPFLCHFVMASRDCRGAAGAPLSRQELGRKALSLAGVNRLGALLEDWNEGQIFLQTAHQRLLAIRGSASGGDGESPREEEGFPLDPAYPAERWLEASAQLPRRPSLEQTRVTVRVASELRSMLERYPAFLTVRGDPQILFRPHGAPRLHSYRNLSALNWQRVLVRALLEGYARDPRRANLGGGINLDEAQELIETLMPFLADLKIVDEQSVDLYKKRFREACLFTPVSDGDALLEFDEGVQYLGVLWSVSPLAARIYAGLEEPCGLAQGAPPGSPELDAYGRRWLKESCVEQELFARFDSIASHMPTMRRYYRGLVDAAEREEREGKGETSRREALAEFRYFLLEASRQNSVPVGWFNSYIAEGVGSVLQFVEVLFARFDFDSDGVLSAEEAEAAKPVFMPTLATLSPRQERFILNGLFTFLLAKGRAPELDACGKLTAKGTSEMLGWLLRPSPSFKVDRSRMLSIFREIVVLTGPQPDSCVSR